MTVTERPSPSDLDLEAYLDDELEPAERIKVIEWLLGNPEKMREFAEIQLREDLLRSALLVEAQKEGPSPGASGGRSAGNGFNLGSYAAFAFGCGAGVIATITLLTITL